MKENRVITLTSILRWEGSDLNTAPSEPGGASKFGVSVDFLTDYHKKHGWPRATIHDVSVLTNDDAMLIYNEMLLDPLQFDDLPSGVDFRLADLTTNLGMTGGPNLLQLCLGMYPLTGKIDKQTIDLVKSIDPKTLVIALSAAWIAVKHQSPNWGPNPPTTKTGFGHGWSNRNNAQRDDALALIK